MRASRLLELLLLLQVRGGASAPDLARELEVSTRTVYRDVEALAAAGVPVYAESGRGGGIRLAPGYRGAGLPPMRDDEARGLVLAAVPTVADALGLAAAAGEDKLFAALDDASQAAARSVRQRLLIEAEPWWRTAEPTPHLGPIADAVFGQWELRITYRERDVVVQPLGLVVKAGTWYLMARSRGSDRLYRVGRVQAVTRLAHRFSRPAGFDLADAWAARKDAFVAAIPELPVVVRVSPVGRSLVGLLQEGTPRGPLPRPDADDWTTLSLQFERVDSAARLLLQLGADVEVMSPPELRERVRSEIAAMSKGYRSRPS